MENVTIKDLKAQAYDKISQIEQLNYPIMQLQEELNIINQQIRKMIEEEAVKKAEEEASKEGIKEKKSKK